MANPFRISFCCEGDPEKGSAHELRRSYSSITITLSGGCCGKQGYDDKVVSKKEHATTVLRSKDKCRKQKKSLKMSNHMRTHTHPKKQAPFRSASEIAIGHRSSGQISESDLDTELIPIRL